MVSLCYLLQKPMAALTEASNSNTEAGVIRCDSKFYCSAGTTCCKGSTGSWTCCPYPLVWIVHQILKPCEVTV